MFIAQKGVPNYQTATHNIVWDGNSLIVGFNSGVGNNMPAQVIAKPPLQGKGFTVRSGAENAINWEGMRLSHITNINSMFQAGKRNILFTWEGTNNICGRGRTGVQSCADAKLYVDALKAVNPTWEVYNILTLPRRLSGVFGSIPNCNAQLIAYNDEMKSKYKTYGFSGVVDVRPAGSPFLMQTFNEDDFYQLDPYIVAGERWGEVSYPQYTHLNTLGYSFVAKYVAQKLRSLGVR